MNAADGPSQPKTPWLLSNKDFKQLTNVDHIDEWLLFIFWDNGITSPNDSYIKLHLARFQYTNLDCSFCGALDKHYVLNTGQWKCKKCFRTFSLTSGTYIENTKLGCHMWWRFSFLIGEKKVTNSSTIAHDLGLTQKTTWGMIETLRRARKETSDKKFLNGQEALSFNNIHEVIDVLLKSRTKSTPKTDLLKQIYGCVVNHKEIPFKEISYFPLTSQSAWKKIHLQFKYKDVFMDIVKMTRIKIFRGDGAIGEERYVLCSPEYQKPTHIKNMFNALVLDKKSNLKTSTLESGEVTQTDEKEDVLEIPIEPDSEIVSEPPIFPVEEEVPDSDSLPEVKTEPVPPILSPLTKKECTKKECRKIKPISEFYKIQNSDKYVAWCKECISTHTKQSRLRERTEKAKTPSPSPKYTIKTKDKIDNSLKPEKIAKTKKGMSPKKIAKEISKKELLDNFNRNKIFNFLNLKP